MKITVKKLQEIIKEEINYALMEENIELSDGKNVNEGLKTSLLSAMAGLGIMLGAGNAQAKEVNVNMYNPTTKEEAVVKMDDKGKPNAFAKAMGEVNKKGGFQAGKGTYFITAIDGVPHDALGHISPGDAEPAFPEKQGVSKADSEAKVSADGKTATITFNSGASLDLSMINSEPKQKLATALATKVEDLKFSGTKSGNKVTVTATKK